MAITSLTLTTRTGPIRSRHSAGAMRMPRAADIPDSWVRAPSMRRTDEVAPTVQPKAPPATRGSRKSAAAITGN